MAIVDRETRRRAESHLARLAQEFSPSAPLAPDMRWRRARTMGRRLRLLSTRVGLTMETLRRAARSPRHPLGRARARWRLLAKRQALDLRVLALLAVIAAVWILSRADLGGRDKLLWGVATAAFTGSFLGLLALLWSDFFRSPFLAWWLRREIVRRPELILPTTPGSTKLEIIPRDETLATIPRSELQDEVVPSILAKDRDVQVIVGEPGSGKTTALVGLAGTLAKIGIVPVLVPLRGERAVNVVNKARETFQRQVGPHMRSATEEDTLWRWLYRRKRIAVLIDDIDQIGAEGEKGFVLRRTLDALATEDLPVVVTARPAGIPAGVAASAIDLGDLEEKAVLDEMHAAIGRDPGTRDNEQDASRRALRFWVRGGNLTQVPFYLELLALLTAAEGSPAVPRDAPAGAVEAANRFSRVRGHGVDANPLAVRFDLLERFHAGVRAGRVRRWLGIEVRERASALRALEDAALGMLLSTGLAARATATAETPLRLPRRRRLEDFINPDDRAHLGWVNRLRKDVSAHEVVDTGERLRLLERDHDGHLQFRHRIMQAYLAARRLVDEDADWGGDELRRAPTEQQEAGRLAILKERVENLLDPHHPEKLTSHMTLTFAAFKAEGGSSARWRRAAAASGNAHEVGEECRTILRALVEGAKVRLPDPRRVKPEHAAETYDDKLNPFDAPDPENRIDPDDALIKLTTAAEIAGAVGCPSEIFAPAPERPGLQEPIDQKMIVRLAQRAHGATKWTKLGAIRAIAALDVSARWNCIWEFMRDADYAVRRAASSEIQASAIQAYEALADEIDQLILKAAARSDLGLGLMRSQAPDVEGADDEDREAVWKMKDWSTRRHILPLKALGWVLPAIVSGLREEGGVPTEVAPEGQPPRDDPALEEATAPALESMPDAPQIERRARSVDRAAEEGAAGVEEEPPAGNAADEMAARRSASRPALPTAAEAAEIERRARSVHRARQALERLVALSCESGHHDLEASLAQGFKGDALRHAEERGGGVTGPGWVSSNRRLVAEIFLDHAEFWYSRLLLHQALALYAIVGANQRETLDIYARLLHGDRERHLYPRAAARLARIGVERQQLRSDRWNAVIWDDEGQVVARRPTALNDDAARLVGDVTVLLNLNERSGDDRQAQFGYQTELPYCLRKSPDRAEILGLGCHARCGWGLCPYKQPPPDEPNAHRGVSRAFCRHQRHIARHGRSRFQRRAIRRRKLEAFWREMERRART
jgi:hypothetical protein